VALADGLLRSALAGTWKPLGGLVLAVLVVGIGSAALPRAARPVDPPPRAVPGEDTAANREAPSEAARKLECKRPTLILEHEIQKELNLNADQLRKIREVIQEVHGRHQEDFNKLRELAAERLRTNEARQPVLLPQDSEEVRARFAAFT